MNTNPSVFVLTPIRQSAPKPASEINEANIKNLMKKNCMETVSI
ncbi:hypothetical protein AGRO_4475 [Agrobacterium sp. ATCC 31749]|nr:hypothetical protein AGRO_4475 [Agrobacterium sp. ATCC 31749]